MKATRVKALHLEVLYLRISSLGFLLTLQGAWLICRNTGYVITCKHYEQNPIVRLLHYGCCICMRLLQIKIPLHHWSLLDSSLVWVHYHDYKKKKKKRRTCMATPSDSLACIGCQRYPYSQVTYKCERTLLEIGTHLIS